MDDFVNKIHENYTVKTIAVSGSLMSVLGIEVKRD